MEKLLATLFDSFKAKNPVVATVVLLVLGTANYIFSSPDAAAIFGELGAKIGYWVSLVWMAVQGSRTTSLLLSTNTKEKQ